MVIGIKLAFKINPVSLTAIFQVNLGQPVPMKQLRWRYDNWTTGAL